MRTFTLKGLFLTAVFMVLGCLAIHAADDDLITRQITVKLDEAGTLPDKIGSIKKYKLTNLKIVGEINGTDLRFIREMAGKDVNGNGTAGKMATLDLSEAKIVKGGDYYYSRYRSTSYVHTDYYTSDDVIGEYAFENCSGLTSVTFPSSVTSIGEYAFSGCSGLTSVTIPSSVTSIGDSAFSGCSNLKECNCILASDLENSLVLSHRFWYRIPVDVIKYYQNGQELTKLEIPFGVDRIGDCSFYKGANLTSVTIPSSVTSIGRDAFSGCSGLTSVTIPSSVTSIGGYAFSGCSGLTSVYVSWKSPLSINASIFENVNTKSCILYVPKGTYDDYWLSNWGVFDNIEEYDVTGIDNVTTSSDVKEISRYSVNGQRLKVPTKGLNIVKYSDGSVKKVVVQ